MYSLEVGNVVIKIFLSITHFLLLTYTQIIVPPSQNLVFYF